MTSHLWAANSLQINFPFALKRIVNYIDDTASPVLRSRNNKTDGISSPRISRPSSPKGFLDPQAQPHAQTQAQPQAQTQSQLHTQSQSPSCPFRSEETRKSPLKSATDKISECLYSGEIVDIEKLKKLAWNGIPDEFRPLCWKILMGYLPVNLDRHESILSRKRREYREITIKYFGTAPDLHTLKTLSDQARSRLDFNDEILHQISIDIPRTCSESAVFQVPRIQASLLRILYCWSIRRPATGYVQGINDLVTPFYSVFLVGDPESLAEDGLFAVEADVFWCFSNLLDTIQDSYTFNQSGIYRQVSLLREISLRMDPQLVKHLEAEGVQFIQFAFRWMNCLLLREFRLPTIKRLWDAYLSEGPDGFKSFHPYICTAFLLKWRRELQVLEFQDIIVFLQRPPTANWTDRDVEVFLAEAFVLKSLFNK